MRPAAALTAGVLLLILSGCSLTEQKPDSSPAAHDPALPAADRPDPFAMVEDSIRHLDAGAGAEKAATRPPHLWARIVERFEFAECEAGSRADQWARWYGERDEYMQRVLGRARPWLYDIAGQLETRQLPGELALLPIVESAYDSFAYSRGQAAGPWQFVSATARDRGLIINDYYDGRRDPWASTRAALDYLEYLENRFGDWNLALAAYNGGQGRVGRAIEKNRKNGLSTDWNQLPLPRETLAYVPKLHGLGCLFSRPEQYGFKVPVWDNRPRVERVELEHPVDIVAFSAATGISIADLVAANPGLSGHMTSPEGPHHLVVPFLKADRARAALKALDPVDMQQWQQISVSPGDTLSHLAARHGTTVDKLRAANNLNNDFLRAGQTLRLATVASAPQNPEYAQRYAELETLHQRLLPTERYQHQVQPGESLWQIARNYSVTVDDLKRWNGISGAMIRPGDRIVINMTHPAAIKTRRYTVKNGDSLWVIARRHNVSVKELMRWNGLANGAVLQPGQTLTIRGGRSSA